MKAIIILFTLIQFNISLAGDCNAAVNDCENHAQLEWSYVVLAQNLTIPAELGLSNAEATCISQIILDARTKIQEDYAKADSVKSGGLRISTNTMFINSQQQRVIGFSAGAADYSPVQISQLCGENLDAGLRAQAIEDIQLHAALPVVEIDGQKDIVPAAY